AEVSLTDVVVFAGRGADGLRGDDSSENLAQVGAMSLSDLDGVDGTSGQPGTRFSTCYTVSGGTGGAKFCNGTNVSGGNGGATTCPDLGCNQDDACPNAGCTDYTSGGVCDIDEVLENAVANPAPSPGRGAAPGAGGAVTYDAPTNRLVCNF